SPGQSHDALPARSGSLEDAEGSQAPSQVLAVRMKRAFESLAWLALALTFIVVVVGAYVRLSDAGLGCPDWPLCYGEPIPGEMESRDALVKAWKEMGHRYLAGLLGLVLIALMVLAWRLRRWRGLTTGIVALALFQATLGAWTVTMLL